MSIFDSEIFRKVISVTVGNRADKVLEQRAKELARLRAENEKILREMGA